MKNIKKRLSWLGGFFVFLGVLLLGILLEINDLTVRKYYLIICGGIGMIWCLYHVLVPGDKSFKLKEEYKVDDEEKAE